MKRLIENVLADCLLLAAGVAWASAGDGNCQYKAKDATLGVNNVTLVRSWWPDFDEEGKDIGEWEDGGDSSLKIGARWYKANLKVGSNYVVWVEDSSQDGIDFELTADDDLAERCPVSEFATYDHPQTGVTYYYIRSAFSAESEDGYWSSDDSDLTTATFYFHFSGTSGEACKVYLMEQPISTYAPSGSSLNPIQIDLETPGSASVVDVGEDDGACNFTASLAADAWYVLSSAGEIQDPPDFSLNDYDDPSVTNETILATDPLSGGSVFKVRSNHDNTMVLKVVPDEVTSCTLSWRLPEVGQIGLKPAELEVLDSAGVAQVAVCRSSFDMNVCVKWTTVAETARVGFDYTPQSGYVYFEENGDLAQTLEIPLVPGIPPEDGVRMFAVRLQALSADELAGLERQTGEAWYSPAPDPQVAQVAIRPTGTGEPVPEMPEARQEPAATPLASGTFAGVLAGLRSGSCELSADASGNLAGTLSIDGFTAALSGKDGEVSGTTTVGEETFAFYLDVKLPEGTVGDLATVPGLPARVSGSIYLLVDGQAEEVFLSGDLYRVESRLDSPTLTRLRRKAGRYTVTLTGDAVPGDPAGIGYLTVDVAGDGSVTAWGALADGTSVSSNDFSAVANDVDGGLAIPVLWQHGTASLSGTLMLGLEEPSLTWCDSRRIFGPDGVSTLRATLTAAGAKYDYWTALARLYNGWALTVNDRESFFNGLEIEVADGVFYANQAVGLRLDRAAGVLSGQRDGHSFAVVLLTDDFAQGATGAAGFSLDGSGASSPLEFQLNWLDPDWSENVDSDISVTVAFDPNGGSGTPPSPITSPLGEGLRLPTCSLTREARYRFAGWLNPLTGNLDAPGADVETPPEDVTFVAQWEDLDVKEALDCDFSFFPVAEKDWSVVTDPARAVKGESFVRAVGSAQAVSEIRTTVDSAGTLSFYWSLERRTDISRGRLDDAFALYVDGAKQAELRAIDQDGFVKCECTIAQSGSHEIRWVYDHSAAQVLLSGNGRVELDAVEWEPYDPSMVIVTFDPGEDAIVTFSNLYRKVGAEIGRFPIATRPHFECVGWKDAAGADVTVKKTVPESGLALFASWQPAAITVDFDGNGATSGVPDPIPGCRSGDTVTLPANVPVRSADYAFAGWSWDGNVYAPGDQAGPLLEDTTFVATWTNVRYQRALKTDLPVEASGWDLVEGIAGSTENVCLKSTVEKLKATAEVTVTAEGPGTVGFRWALEMSSLMTDRPTDRLDFYVDAEATPRYSLTAATAWTEVADVEVEGEGTHVLRWVFTATDCMNQAFVMSWGRGLLDTVVWTPAGPRITVTFDPNGGTVNPTSVRVPTNGVLTTLPTPVNEGFGFAGWYDEYGTLVTAPYPVGEEDITLTATWGALPVTVSFAAGGGEGTPPDPVPVVPYAEWYLPEADGLSKAHSAFAGWTDGVGVYAAGALYDNVETAMTFTATWTFVACRVTFDANGGECPTVEKICDRGATFGDLPTASRDGFDFGGWTNALGEAVTPTSIVPDVEETTLFAKWDALPISVTFDGNGATRDVPGPIPGCRSGDTVTLPAGEPFRSADYVFAGWSWNGGVYAPGEQVGPLFGDTTFVAEWTNVRYQRALKTDLPVEANGWDLAEGVAGSTSNVCLKSTVTELRAMATATVTVDGPGAVSFRWALEMSSLMTGQPTDRLDFFVDGELTPRLSLTAKTAWSEVADVEIAGERTHELRWVYTATTALAPAFVSIRGCGLLDWVKWASTDYSVVVTWGAHILGATYAIEGGARGEVAASGASVVVPAGKSVEIVGRADSDNWYYVSSGGGRFTEAGVTEIVAALRDEKTLPSDIRPQDVGLSTAAGAPFATADVNEIANVIGWARANGKTVSEMNALRFSEGASGDPLDLASTAYLLNCASAEGAVAEALAAFRFTSFDPANPPTAADFADRGYNGTVKILKATTLADGGDWSEGDSADFRFYKARLVK